MTVITFNVYGPPVPKARARTTLRGSYTPKRTSDYEARIACAARLALADLGQPWDIAGTYALRVLVFPYQSEAQQRKRVEDRRGDWDNYGKIVSDALNVVLWADDRQVVNATVIVCMPSVRPGIQVYAYHAARPQLPNAGWPVHVPNRRRKKSAIRR